MLGLPARLSTCRALALALAAIAIGMHMEGQAFAQLCPLTFTPASTIIDPPAPICIASGDFNADARRDLVVVNQGFFNAGNYSNASVSILLANAGGGFNAPVHLSTPAPSYSVAVADFNHDNKLDLAVVGGTTTGLLYVFVGNGDGTFQAAHIYPVGSSPYGVVAANLNFDANIDIAVVNFQGGSVSILMGNGDGTFGPAATVGGGLINPSSIVAADFDNDTRIDLAVSNYGSNSVTILRNFGGTFAASATYTASGSPFCVAAADLDNDNRIDLVTANAQGSFTVLRNIGVSFTNQTTPLGGTPNCVSIGDLNGDGILDLAILQLNANSVATFRGNGNGTFQAQGSYSAGPTPYWATIAELTGDGRPDLAVANLSGSVVSILAGNLPVFTFNPTGNAYTAGQTVMFTANATGSGPLTYRWRKNGVPLNDGGNVSGATSTTLTLSPVFVGDAGTYDLRATDPCGSQGFSMPAGISVSTPVDPCDVFVPIVTLHPARQNILSGGNASFTVAATAPAAATISYQWRRDGVNLTNTGIYSGADSAVLMLTAATLANDGDAYDCVVSTGCGTARSNPAGLGVTWACPADFNHSAVLSVQDIFDFLAAYFAGCP